MKISTTNCEQTQNGDPFCCLFEKIKNNTKFLLSLILFFGLVQGVFAQGTLQPACNIVVHWKHVQKTLLQIQMVIWLLILTLPEVVLAQY